MSLFRMVETQDRVYIVPADICDFVQKMHPECFDKGELRAMANSHLVIDKASGKVIKARSFDPRGNE
ncbi:hypothetical protein PP459_gp099 [Streptomyces phage Wakanda]|uniref:Uncharacterized protein n=1 Tax=Streptomyces phage Wakanda TaxID=2713267 RepID=A0A6G8R1S5_9CAUD|nr:hypothetical protein PP459_gp099 [Streptomyces phage Wakanda]QIN94134.1 hypothetical protein SEA_WAKANDA_172 [Streptomyces phage Wakanda]